MIFDKYPYTNFHEMNDDWVIQTLRAFDQRLDEFVAANSLTYADPIEYDPATIYPANTVVVYNDAAYVSKQAVPAGTLPSADSDYWLMIFPFGELINSAVDDMENRIDEALAAANAQIDEALAAANAQLEIAIRSVPSSVNDWMAAHPDVVSAVPFNSVNWQKLTTEMRSVILADYDKTQTRDIVFTEQGGLNHTNGAEFVSTQSCRTGFMQFPAGVMVFAVMSGYQVSILRYDDNGNYIGYTSVGSTITPAPGLVAVAVAAGEQYRFDIIIDGLTDIAPENLPFGVLLCDHYARSGVSVEEFDELVRNRYGVYVSHNMLTSEESLTAGYYIAANGTIGTGTSFAYTDYIPVSAGDVLRTYYAQSGAFAAHDFRFVCCYDESFNVLSNKGSNASVRTLTIPEGVAYVRVTVYNNNTITDHVVSLNTVVSEYHAYEAPSRSIVDDFLSPESKTIIDDLKTGNLSSTHLRNDFHCSLPRQALKMTKGLPEDFYYWCAMFPPKTTYGYATAGVQYTSQHNNKVEFPNTATLTAVNGFNWRMYDAMYALIDSYAGSAGLGGERHIINENLSNCTLLAIGDSTVDQDTMTSQLLDHFAAQSKTLTLLGTLGNGSNKNEGRAGWKVSDYLTNKQYQGVVNPFYNPATQTFDFSYYMTNQQYATVDFVVLQMGINDLSSNADPITIWTNLKVIIDSILAYDSTIKVLLNLPTTPNSDPSETDAILYRYLRAVCEYDEYAMAQVLSEYTAAKVRTSYCHLILDPETDIRDNVHPTSAGYQKMALEIINQINHWQNGD